MIAPTSFFSLINLIEPDRRRSVSRPMPMKFSCFRLNTAVILPCLFHERNVQVWLEYEHSFKLSTVFFVVPLSEHLFIYHHFTVARTGILAHFCCSSLFSIANCERSMAWSGGQTRVPGGCRAPSLSAAARVRPRRRRRRLVGSVGSDGSVSAELPCRRRVARGLLRRCRCCRDR